MKRILFIILVICTVSFVFASVKLKSDDLFWHLKVAEYQNVLSPLKQNLFSFSYPEHVFLNSSVVFDQVVSALVSFVEVDALSLLQALLIALCFGILFFSVKGHVSYFSTVFFLICAVFTLRHRLLFEPHNFAYLFFAINLLLVQKPAAGYFILLMCNQILWSNIHPSALFGILNPLFFLIANLNDKKNSKMNLYFGECVILLALVSMVNHTGYAIFNEMTSFLIGAGRALKQNISLPFFLILLAGSSITIFFANKKKNIVIFFFYSILALIRHDLVDFYALTAFYVSLDNISRGKEKYSLDKFAFREINVFRGVIKTVIIAVLLYFAGIDYLSNPSVQKGFGVGADTNPEGAVRFIEKNNIKGNVFNSYSFGGYLIFRLYPSCRPIIDERPAYPETFINSYFAGHEFEESFWELLSKYPADIFIIGYDHPKLALFVNSLKYRYALCYFDDTAMVFLKRNDSFQNVIIENEIRYLKPQYISEHDDALKYAEGNPRIKAELESILEKNMTLRAMVMYGNLLLGEGKTADAEAMFSNVVRSDIPAAKSEALNNIGVIYITKGDYKKAKQFFKRSIFYNKDYYRAHFNLAEIYYLEKKYILAKYHYSVYISGSKVFLDSKLSDKINKLNYYLKILAVQISIIALSLMLIGFLLYRVFRRISHVEMELKK